MQDTGRRGAFFRRDTLSTTKMPTHAGLRAKSRPLTPRFEGAATLRVREKETASPTPRDRYKISGATIRK